MFKRKFNLKEKGTQVTSWLSSFLSKQRLLILVSSAVGLLSGLVAVLIKHLTFSIQTLLGGGYISNYHNAYYFIFPLFGLIIVYLLFKIYSQKRHRTRDFDNLIFYIKA